MSSEERHRGERTPLRVVGGGEAGRRHDRDRLEDRMPDAGLAALEPAGEQLDHDERGAEHEEARRRAGTPRPARSRAAAAGPRRGRGAGS